MGVETMSCKRSMSSQVRHLTEDQQISNHRQKSVTEGLAGKYRGTAPRIYGNVSRVSRSCTGKLDIVDRCFSDLAACPPISDSVPIKTKVAMLETCLCSARAQYMLHKSTWKVNDSNNTNHLFDAVMLRDTIRPPMKLCNECHCRCTNPQ